MTQKLSKCAICMYTGFVFSWGFLLFGGLVGALPKFGLPEPSQFWAQASAILMLISLLYFGFTAVLRAMTLR